MLLNRTVFRPHPVPVTVRRVETGRVENTVVNSRAGTVQSRRRSEMSPGIPGLVVAIPARKGAHVKQGEVLLCLDDREYVAQTNLAAAASGFTRLAQSADARPKGNSAISSVSSRKKLSPMLGLR